ncbi:hypothetical protein MNV49_006178 [Pseudohyphozyma bogoriensis]|nr:hypothetical protein MNV49_006178 [Pseudohyphozyma bogoriensis]
MGGGNGAKANAKREANAKKAAGAGGGSQLKANAAALTIQCVTCKQVFMSTTRASELLVHAENKHSKKMDDCFPGFVEQKKK